MANIPKPTNLNVIWASTGTKVDPGVTKTNIGWVVQLPPYEYQNWAMNRQDTAIAHFNQHGIPEWDTNTEYQGNLSYSQGSNGFIYKCIQTNSGLDPTNTNNNLYWVLAFEQYGSVAAVQAQLNTHLTNYATLSGISNIVAARANLSVYSKAEGDARYAYKGGDNATPFLVGTATNPQHAVPLSQINSLLVPATESTTGVTQYATVSETETGTIDNKALTPLKASTIYLKKSGNLSGLANYATARSNLGLGTIATRNSTEFLAVTNNLSDLTSQSAARTNLGLGTAAVQANGFFLQTANNLSDLASVSSARTNLGLSTLATTNPTTVMFKTDNLAGLANLATARANLGLGTAAQSNNEAFLWRGNNLGDLTNVQAARNNLGLSAAATLPVQGVLSSFNFQHAGDNPSGGWAFLGTNLCLQWGIGPTLRYDQSVTVGLHIPGAIMSVQVTGYGAWSSDQGPSFLADNFAPSSFRVSENGSEYGRQFMWLAITYV